VTDEGVRWLVNLPALTALDIGGSNVTDRGVEKLASCLTLSLRSLKLQDCNQVTNTAMWALRNLTTLTSLNIAWSTTIDDVGMLSLSTHPALTELNIGYTSVTDEGLRALANMPALTRLDVEGCEHMTEVGVAALPIRVKVAY
jgi:internalin A